MMHPGGTLRARHDARIQETPSILEALGIAVQAWQLEPAHVYMADHAVETLEFRAHGLHEDAVLLLTLLLISRSQGSTCLEIGGSIALSILENLVAAGVGLVDGANGTRRRLELRLKSGGFGNLVSAPGGFSPVIESGGKLYLEQTWQGESRLVSSIVQRLKSVRNDVDPGAFERAFDEVKEALPFRLNDEQVLAIKTCVMSNFSVVSGGPGTGKTTGVVLSALRVLVRLGFDASSIAIAAPTGKAANRMMEAIRAGMPDIHLSESLADRRLVSELQEASTIHRLLGSKPYSGGFRFNARNRLKARVVIIDEASMIDLDLMNALFDAIEPEARLILIGDPFQLPSVNTGAVFRDLVSLKEMGLPAARLETSQRAKDSDVGGREILKLAAGINQSEVLEAPKQMETLDVVFQGVRHFCPSPQPDSPVYQRQDLYAFLDRWYDEHIDLSKRRAQLHRDRTTFQETDEGFTQIVELFVHDLFEHYAKSRILCLTQVYSSGAKAINKFMHQAYGRAHNLTQDLWKQPTIWEGEPVMMLQNDYTLGLFNGDQGIVLYTLRPGESHAKKRVVFMNSSGTYRTVDIGLIRHNIELSYAMTIHKSQGSEYQKIAVILPPADIPLLTREILYTGVTRAKSSVALFGPWPLVELAASRPNARVSGIHERVERSLG
ncbi:exodeoxyribonuclease V subunit alpha [Microvenator marinus]|uniref:Exodeoxyribonuclease V subunit alpha n=1 Tax=Microvenator marinus TaxID=2600177 RepID=A0A5B8Y0A0_9DELT|nr:exodeoxyribonuclease V subunit alpha [Microvenator marinus]QED29356.1 exodeoxyribonuclease V subunit alpha [Microvenator marinus]